MGNIPASQIVSVTPSVLAVGGTGVRLTGLILTDNTRAPIGSVLSFPDQPSVAKYFGPSSQLASLASIYFLGYDNSFIKPGLLQIAQYPTVPVGAYLRGGNVSAAGISAIQAITSGSLTITIDGTAKTASSLNLSSAASFSSAASIIGAGLGIAGPVQASVTGAISSTTLTVSAVTSGTLAVGQVLSGTGVTAGTYISALGSGTGGTGTYTVSVSQTVSSTTITASAPGVSFDSISGGFQVVSATTGASSTITFATGTAAATLKLTQATGAVLSQGAVAGTPATNMAAIASTTENWATFLTTFEPSTSDKLAFALWNSQQNNRHLYIPWDTDATPTQANDTSSFGYQVIQANYSGTAPVYLDLNTAVFLSGAIGSIDTTRTNGRVTLAFRSQTGMQPIVTDGTVALNLQASGYNFYGVYADDEGELFNFFYPGSVSGPFDWIDSYINQIWMNGAFQSAALNLMATAGSIPYNDAGRIMVETSLSAVARQAADFGAIRSGITLSPQQIVEVNADAGADISTTLFQQGWYIQAQIPPPAVRAVRGAMPVNIWYTDGQSVQKITIASIELQ